MTRETAPKDQVAFGYRTVSAGDKPRLVRAVFDSVAPRYDLMNDLMSMGVHRLWKDVLVDVLAPRAGERIVDVAGGTGDIAFRTIRASQGRARVTVCDINATMLDVGRSRAVDRGIVQGLDWLVADAELLPFRSGRFDAYTIAFGLRNVTDPGTALAEAWRMLKPGGRFLCLEFSRLQWPVARELYDTWSARALPLLGRLVAGDGEAYRYLHESIRRFPAQEELAGMMKAAGFANVRWRNLAGGTVALHSGWRI